MTDMVATRSASTTGSPEAGHTAVTRPPSANDICNHVAAAVAGNPEALDQWASRKEPQHTVAVVATLKLLAESNPRALTRNEWDVLIKTIERTQETVITQAFCGELIWNAAKKDNQDAIWALAGRTNPKALRAQVNWKELGKMDVSSDGTSTTQNILLEVFRRFERVVKVWSHSGRDSAESLEKEFYDASFTQSALLNLKPKWEKGVIGEHLDEIPRTLAAPLAAEAVQRAAFLSDDDRIRLAAKAVKLAERATADSLIQALAKTPSVQFFLLSRDNSDSSVQNRMSVLDTIGASLPADKAAELLVQVGPEVTRVLPNTQMQARTQLPSRFTLPNPKDCPQKFCLLNANADRTLLETVSRDDSDPSSRYRGMRGAYEREKGHAAGVSLMLDRLNAAAKNGDTTEVLNLARQLQHSRNELLAYPLKLALLQRNNPLIEALAPLVSPSALAEEMGSMPLTDGVMAGLKRFAGLRPDAQPESHGWVFHSPSAIARSVPARDLFQKAKQGDTDGAVAVAAGVPRAWVSEAVVAAIEAGHAPAAAALAPHADTSLVLQHLVARQQVLGSRPEARNALDAYGGALQQGNNPLSEVARAVALLSVPKGERTDNTPASPEEAAMTFSAWARPLGIPCAVLDIELPSVKERLAGVIAARRAATAPAAPAPDVTADQRVAAKLKP